jgi:hypothetical protein
VEFAFPFHIALIPVAIAGIAVLVGAFLFVKGNKLLGHIIAAFGILFGLAFGPMLLMDRVIVDEQRIRQETGFWFDQTEKGFGFDAIRRVRITTGRDLKGRPIEVWIAEYTDRPSVQIDPGDLWESNGEAITRHMSALGIEVVRERD